MGKGCGTFFVDLMVGNGTVERFSAKSIARQNGVQDERKCDLSYSRYATSPLVTVKSILKPVYATNFTI
jgi:hypothetical protein